MKIQQIYTGCLAHGAYFIESGGEAAVIDPLREVQPYLNRAEETNSKITYVLETHFHADFVSGHLDLADKTGATIVYGPTAKPAFDAKIAEDGELLPLGKIFIKVIHTPGHTMESSCYLLIDENGKEHSIFTGDTLFIGDVGRPDLAQHVVTELTQEKLAGHLYDSLRNKIMPLNDDIIVYPGHGAGSACGKNMSNETTDTLGNQKATNYALNPEMNKEDFITALLDGLTKPPSYFPQNVRLNLNGYQSFEQVLKRGKQALSVISFEAAASETRALIIDSRNPEEFVKGFIPGSINIGLNGNFATWAGTLIPDVKQEILLVTDEGCEEEAITRLARVGFDNCIGYLKGGFNAWLNSGNEIDLIHSITPEALALKAKNSAVEIIDVRKQSEYASEHIEAAINAPLDYINESMLKINPENTSYIHCAAGYRSVTFISILKARGYQNMINITGGFRDLKSSGMFSVSEFEEQKTML